MCHAEHSASAWHIGKLIHCHIDKSANNLLYLFIGFIEFVPAKLKKVTSSNGGIIEIFYQEGIQSFIYCSKENMDKLV